MLQGASTDRYATFPSQGLLDWRHTISPGQDRQTPGLPSRPPGQSRTSARAAVCRNHLERVVRMHKSNPAIVGGFAFGGSQDEDYNIDDLPVFEQDAETLSGRVSARTTDIMLLGIYAVLFFMT